MDNFQGNAVVNYTDYDTPYTRILEHKHFYFQTEGKTVITYEYPKTYAEGDEPYYNITDDKNKQLYETYLTYAKKDEKLIFGGRLGLYKYLNMDEVIKKALDLVKLEFNE